MKNNERTSRQIQKELTAAHTAFNYAANHNGIKDDEAYRAMRDTINQLEYDLWNARKWDALTNEELSEILSNLT
jgi:hypothetical protein